MALPSHVERDAAEAERLMQLAAQAAPVQEPAQGPGESGDSASEPAPQQPAQVAPAPSPPAAEEPWEQRYRTLQGMFQAERQQRDTRTRDLERALHETQQRLREIEQAQATAQPTRPSAEEASVTHKDVEAFGGDLVDLMRRQAQDVVREATRGFMGEVAKRDAEIAKLREALGGVSSQVAGSTQAGFYAELGRAVPDWEAVNAEEGWLAWLGETDPLSGVQRQAYLDDAASKFDVQRTVRLFDAYKARKGSAGQTAKPSTAAQELQRQVQPTMAKAAPAAQPSGQTKVWTSAEIDTFYADWTRGAFLGREAEAQAISSAIDLALAEGRVRP